MWLLFTILTTLLWGMAELFYKRGANPSEKYSHLKICIFVGLVMTIHAVFTLITGDFYYNPVNLIRYLPVSLMYIISMSFSFFGMRFIEESISDPIENTSGAICSLLCVIFLGDRLGLMSVAAILLILTGILGIGFLENHGTTNRSLRLGKRMAQIAFLMPFLYAILDAFGSFLDVFYLEDMAISPLIDVNEETIELVANTSYELTFGVFALILFVYLIYKGEKPSFHGQRTKIAAAVLETAGQFTYVYAMSGNGAIAAPIISGVCVVSLLLSAIFLKERLTARQYFFISLVIIGIIILAIIDG